LDPWYKMISSTDNRSYDVSQDHMDALIDEFKIAIVMIHHDTVPAYASTTGQQIQTFHPRGPRTVEGWYDAMIKIEGDPKLLDRTLHFELRHAQAPKQLDIVFDSTRGVLNIK